MSTLRALKFELFSDPIYGSEQHLTVDPQQVEEVEDIMKFLLFRKHVPATRIVFKSGESYAVHGHHAAEIKDAQETQIEPEA